MKYFAMSLLFLFNSEILSLFALLVMTVFFLLDIMRERLS